mmetsp:Transcript_19355/g.77365  ORF Transcript_19355/g.77365 Transcript_19355/m.77365 type:complete len:124 (-) Transcript_19355:963-1334(-)
MSESSLLKCPHGEGSEMYSPHDLITHLENCPSPCHDGETGSGEVAEGANCDHLAKYEESVSKFWGDKKCPHQSCSKSLNNPQIVPRHLEECLVRNAILSVQFFKADPHTGRWQPTPVEDDWLS